jgi:hypothetical protein
LSCVVFPAAQCDAQVSKKRRMRFMRRFFLAQYAFHFVSFCNSVFRAWYQCPVFMEHSLLYFAFPSNLVRLACRSHVERLFVAPQKARFYIVNS